MLKGSGYRTKIEAIKKRMQNGLITYDEAKKEAEPILAEINTKGAEIAQRWGKKHKPLTFGYVMR